jgi:integrase
MPVTFADAAEAWLLHGERKRALKRSTLVDYRHAIDAYLLPAPPDRTEPDTPYGRAPFATTPVREIRSRQLEEWYERLPTGRTADKLLMIVRGILGHARSRGWAGAGAETAVARRAGPGGAAQPPEPPVQHQAIGLGADHDFYSLAEVDALVRAAANEQDAAIFLTAARTGLRRGELIALRWRDIDHAGHAIRVRANFSNGELVTPRSGKVRSTPMIAEVAQALAGLAVREVFTAEHDPVFTGTAGGYLDGSALSRRYARAAKRAGLRPLPFHSLRHHFGSTAVNRASLIEVQSWMGHAQIQTTARYLRQVNAASRGASI